MRSTGRPTRWGPRLLLRAALVGVLLTLSVGVMAAPAQAATINCTPMSDPACKDLTPIVECVWNNGDGTNTIAWGYNNPSTDTLYIDFGGKNKMAPGADDQGQPTLFTPGMHHNAFVTTVSRDQPHLDAGQQQGRLRARRRRPARPSRSPSSATAGHCCSASP